MDDSLLGSGGINIAERFRFRHDWAVLFELVDDVSDGVRGTENDLSTTSAV